MMEGTNTLHAVLAGDELTSTLSRPPLTVTAHRPASHMCQVHLGPSRSLLDGAGEREGVSPPPPLYHVSLSSLRQTLFLEKEHEFS